MFGTSKHPLQWWVILGQWRYVGEDQNEAERTQINLHFQLVPKGAWYSGTSNSVIQKRRKDKRAWFFCVNELANQWNSSQFSEIEQLKFKGKLVEQRAANWPWADMPPELMELKELDMCLLVSGRWNTTNTANTVTLKRPSYHHKCGERWFSHLLCKPHAHLFENICNHQLLGWRCVRAWKW